MPEKRRRLECRTNASLPIGLEPRNFRPEFRRDWTGEKCRQAKRGDHADCTQEGTPNGGARTLSCFWRQRFLSACDKSEQKPAAASAAAGRDRGQGRRIEVTPTSTFTGRIEAVDKVDLRARVEGFIEKRLFEEGADVKAGDLMFTLEKAPYQASIDRDQGGRSPAPQATLKLADIDAGRQTDTGEEASQGAVHLDDQLRQAGGSRADAASGSRPRSQKAELDLAIHRYPGPALRARRHAPPIRSAIFVGPASGTLATIVSQDPIYVTFPVSQRELLEVRKRGPGFGHRPAQRGASRCSSPTARSMIMPANRTSSTSRSAPPTDTIAIRAAAAQSQAATWSTGNW